MVCQFNPPITAGLPPMSNGIRVHQVSTAVIFMARSRIDLVGTDIFRPRT
jgi:hypothetical protein